MFWKVLFYPTRSNPRWWYVIQNAPRSRHIFDEGGIEEVLSEQAMDEEREMNVITSGQPHSATSEQKRGGSKEETSCDDSSNESAVIIHLTSTMMIHSSLSTKMTWLHTKA